MYNIIICILVITVNLASGQSNNETDITKGPPSYDKPWVPGWGWFGTGNPSGWKNKHEQLLKLTEDHKKDITIVFYGDSKTEKWSAEGQEVWKEYYVKRGAYNYGIGGDSTRQVLWRIDHGELDGLTPKLFVFMIGGNNFGNNYNRGTDEEIVKAETIIVEKVRQKLPKTQFIFVGQLPRGDSTDSRAKDINVLLEKSLKSGDKFVHFYNDYKNYTNSDGSQNKKLYIQDYIHLNKDGYKLLAQNLEPLIKQYL